MPMLEKVCSDVLGLDISTTFLKYGKEKNKYLNLIQGDAHILPLKSKSIDVVTSNAFEFLDRNIAVKEIYRVLKNDGICIAITPNKYSACRMPFKAAARLLRKKRDKNETSRKELISVFENNAFELIQLRMDDGLIWLPSFLDRLCGKEIYWLIEKFFRIFGRNPFSNVMLFVVRKGRS